MANALTYPRADYDANFRKRKVSPEGHVIRPSRLDNNLGTRWHEIERFNIRSSAGDYHGFQYCHPYSSYQIDNGGSTIIPPAYQGYEQLSPKSTSVEQMWEHERPLTSGGADFSVLSSSINCGSFAESARTDGRLSLTYSALTSKPSTPVSTQLCTSRKTSETLCPLITGDIDTCQPALCGPNAACLHFPSLPPIEECAFVPGTTSQRLANKTYEFKETVETPDQTEISVPLSPPLSLVSSAGVSRTPSSNQTTTETGSSPSLDPKELTRPGREDKKSDRVPSPNSSKLKARQAHSLVERKYRENLNAKITQLHEILQASHFGQQSQQLHQQLLTQLSDTQTSKVRKSDVLIEAMDYVKNAEERMRIMTDQIAHMHQVIAELQNPTRFGGG